MSKYFYIAIRSFSIGLLVFFYANANAQQLNDVNSSDLTRMQLPPLEVLFENAKSSPGVAMYEAKVESQESLLTTERRAWLKYFKVGGSYQYGNIAINSAFTNENTPLFMQATGQIQNSWYGTAGLNIPLEDLFDRGNRVKRQKIERRYTELEMEKWLDEQRIRITESYMRVKLYLATLDKRVEEYTFAKANFFILEKEFKIGKVTIADLNAGKMKESDAIVRLKTNEFDLLNEVIRLEILSKTKIISK